MPAKKTAAKKVAKQLVRPEQEAEIIISPLSLGIVEIPITGDAPYVQNRFGPGAKGEIRRAQTEGDKAKNRNKKAPKDFEAMGIAARHVSTEGWYGIPANAFRNALVDVCRVAGMTMVKAKMCVFCEADGWDADGNPLVRITKGEPEHCEHIVRLQGTKTDLHARSMWKPGWEAKPRIRFDADQFSPNDIFNLMYRVGIQIGVGEGRPFSKTSCGMGWGTFQVKADELRKTA